MPEGAVINELEEEPKLYILISGKIQGDTIHKPVVVETRRQSAIGSERLRRNRAKHVA